MEKYLCIFEIENDLKPMNKPLKYAVFGAGSWATAIVKMLCENLDEVGGHTHVTEHSSGEEEYHYHMLNELFFGEGTDDYLIFEGPYKGF